MPFLGCSNLTRQDAATTAMDRSISLYQIIMLRNHQPPLSSTHTGATGAVTLETVHFTQYNSENLKKKWQLQAHDHH